MTAATIIMAILAVALTIFAYFRGGDLYILGLKGGAQMLWEVLPLLIASFVVAGLIQVLVPKELISRWVGVESGLRGILIGSVVGGVTPGGPYVSFPIVASLYKAGASIGTVVAFVSAWSLWAVARLPMEVALIGPRATLVRVLSTLIFPPIAGIIAQTFFGKFA